MIRPGHEACWVCDDCGLPMCPDCDTENRACVGHGRTEYDRQLDAWLDGTRKTRPTATRDA